MTATLAATSPRETDARERSTPGLRPATAPRRSQRQELRRAAAVQAAWLADLR